MQKLVMLQVPLDGGETKVTVSGSTYRAEVRAVVVLFAGEGSWQALWALASVGAA